MSQYTIEIHATIEKNRRGQVWAMIEVEIVKDSTKEVKNCMYMDVYAPNWFERVVLKKTFEGKVRSTSQFLVKEASKEINRIIALETLQHKMSEAIDKLFH